MARGKHATGGILLLVSSSSLLVTEGTRATAAGDHEPAPTQCPGPGDSGGSLSPPREGSGARAGGAGGVVEQRVAGQAVSVRSQKGGWRQVGHPRAFQASGEAELGGCAEAG